MWSPFLALPAHDDGTVAIEYALIAVLISIVIIAGCITIGNTIAANFFGPIASAF
jgi:Flp pilus assembly pilin Flp